MLLKSKFFVGVGLIIGNFVIGKIALPLFALAPELGIALYAISWLMLIAGLVLCGRQGLDYARLYYHHFKRKFKRNAIMKNRKDGKKDFRPKIASPLDYPPINRKKLKQPSAFRTIKLKPPARSR